MALEQEMQTYERALPALLEQTGKFALVAGDRVLGTFAAYEDALQAGYAQVGLAPFLVKQIFAHEQVQFITRDVVVPVAICPN